MRILKISILLLCALLIPVGCVAVGPSLIPITNPTERLEFQGFSISPPAGENWFIAPPELRQKQGPNISASFVKMLKPPSPTQTIVAYVLTFNVPASLAESREQLLQLLGRAKTEPTDRNRPIASKTSLDRSLGTDCLRYDVTTEDRGAPLYPGTVFILEMHGFSCFHPELPNYVIDVQYSQRRLPSEQPLSLEAEGEPFLKSLVFTRLGR